MSNLDLIRSLRRALTELRDVRDPADTDTIARALATELVAKLAGGSPSGFRMSVTTT